jgi:hypothetical protein
MGENCGEPAMKGEKKALIPINATRCGSCTFLERTIAEDSNGRITEWFKCPKNRVLPSFAEPFFAEKCSMYKPKTG